MTYASGHRLLTVHWQSVGTLETGQFGLRFLGDTDVSQSLVDSLATAVSTWWASTSTLIPSGKALAFLRLAHIGVDGKYVPGTIAYDHTYSPVVAGGGSGSNSIQPPQVANVISLTTDLPRGRAHRGRVYAPTIAASYTAPGVWDPSVVTPRVTSTVTMLNALNVAMGGSLAVMSKIGAGASHVVTGIAIGSRPDVQRRRAKGIVETYSTGTVTP